ncbi:hypothetical protein SAMN02799625_04672 [Methylobacterium sp. UNC300MFChir4.1]|nr:hypothetical protein SAMN02799625_04672 [Methylobacterium sp. UNC300MFChir4.1]
MRPARFHTLLKVKCEPELQTAIVAAAERDRTTVSEFLRRELRALLNARSSDQPDPPPSAPAGAMKVAA